MFWSHHSQSDDVEVARTWRDESSHLQLSCNGHHPWKGPNAGLLQLVSSQNVRLLVSQFQPYISKALYSFCTWLIPLRFSAMLWCSQVISVGLWHNAVQNLSAAKKKKKLLLYNVHSSIKYLVGPTENRLIHWLILMSFWKGMFWVFLVPTNLQLNLKMTVPYGWYI